MEPKMELNNSLNKILEWNKDAKKNGYKITCEKQIINYLK